jgi:predicted Holliday junction resolvase-like endonuclease
MEARNVIFSVVMVFSTFVLTYRLWGRYRDSAIALSAVILVGMLALLFLSIDERLRKIEKDISEKERSLRVSLQSVEEEVREKVGTSTRRLEEIREDILKRGYR